MAFEESHSENTLVGQEPELKYYLGNGVLEVIDDGHNYNANQTSQEQNDNEEEKLVHFHDLYAYDSENNPIFFHSLIGKVVLVVNVATQCASAYQLRQLEQLYQKYKDKEFTILAFPSNQFHQEIKGTNQEVAANCRRKFDVSFPIMEKVKVNGKEQSEVFRYLKDKKKGFLRTKRVKWNFEKFLVGRDGEILHRYSILQKANGIIEKDLNKLFETEEIEAFKSRIQKVQKSKIQRVVYI